MSNHAAGYHVILSEMLENLPESEKKVAVFILEHPEEAINLTAKELGKRSGTSGAAVIRLCKSLKLKSFQELKMRIAVDLQNKNYTEYREINPDESINSIIQKMTSNSIQAIKETAAIMNQEELKKAVNMIRKARKIIFIGVGASGIVAQDAKQKFLRIDKNVYAFTDIHMAATQIAVAGHQDVVIVISHSGETMEIVNMLQLAKQKKIPTIGITKYGKSKVAEQADVILFTSSGREPVFRSGATASRVAQLHVIDILYIAVASKEFEKSVEYLDATRKVVEFLKSKHRS